jgi:predicted AAA+ superfamily ATPase
MHDFTKNENFWKSRWSQDQIKSMLLEQFDSFWKRETGIPRNRLAYVKQASGLPHAVIVSGLRRVGKSTLRSPRYLRLPENFWMNLRARYNLEI